MYVFKYYKNYIPKRTKRIELFKSYLVERTPNERKNCCFLDDDCIRYTRFPANSEPFDRLLGMTFWDCQAHCQSLPGCVGYIFNSATGGYVSKKNYDTVCWTSVYRNLMKRIGSSERLFSNVRKIRYEIRADCCRAIDMYDVRT